MRQREWEWFQYKDGVIGKDVYEEYHAVIGIALGILRTRKWWQKIGWIGFKPEFVADVDRLLANRGMTNYSKRRGDTTLIRTDRQSPASRPAKMLSIRSLLLDSATASPQFIRYKGISAGFPRERYRENSEQRLFGAFATGN